MHPHQKSYVHLLLILLTLPIVLINGCQKGNPVTFRETVEGTIILETTVNPSTDKVTVSIPNKISIEIPQGVVPDGTKLTISEIDPSYWSDDKDYVIHQVYEVKIGTIKKFSPPLKITIQYDSTKIPPGKFKYAINGAFLDEANRKWRMFTNTTIDSIRYTVTIETNHLTKLCILGYRSLWSGYTDYYQTEHFNFYWKEGDISSNTEYNSPNKSEYDQAKRTEPHYVLDVAKWAEYCMTRYESEKLTTWYFRANVFFTNVVDDKGNSAAGEMTWEWLNINKKADKDPEDIKSTIAHEILHLIQDYYYFTMFPQVRGTTINPIRWWMEATATQADRIVWPTGKAKYEAESAESNTINENIDKSWDNCYNDPGWYVAGGFLTYLSVYTPERKASIPEMIKRVGDATDVSYIRTIIDNYLKTDLSLEKGIAHEYYDYLMAAYLKKHPIRMTNVVVSPALKSWPSPYDGCRIKSSTDKFTFKQSLPYMSAKIFRVYNYTTGNDVIQEVKINMKTVPEDLEANLFERDIDPNTDDLKFIKTLWTKDAVTTSLKPVVSGKSNKMLEIFVINKNKDAKWLGEPEIEFTVEPAGYSLAITPAGLNGYANQEYTFTVHSVSGFPNQFKIAWKFGQVTGPTISNDSTVKYTFTTTGSYQVVATLLDNNNQPLGEATTDVTILDEGEQYDFTTLTKVKVFLDFDNTLYYSESDPNDTYDGNQLCNFAGFNDAQRSYFPGVQGRKYTGSWTGRKFTGSSTGGTCTIELASDKKSISTFSCTFSGGSSDLNNLTITQSSVEGVDIERTLFQKDFMAEFRLTGNQKANINSLDYRIRCKVNPNLTYVLKLNQSSLKQILIRFDY